MRKHFLLILMLVVSGISFSQVSKLVKGTLIDEKSEKAVEDVTVVLKNTETKDSFATTTNENGFFQFKNIPFGNYEFRITDKLYKKDSTFTFDINQDHADNFTFGQPITANLKVSWLFNWGDRTMTDATGKVYVQEHYWSHFVGKIVLVTKEGKLQVMVDPDQQAFFDIKEIKMLY